MESKSIVVFGGSSELGQDITAKLAAGKHSVINVDHVKSDVEGVIRYPYDAGTSQTKGILGLVSPDLIVNCAEFDETSPVDSLTYISKLCAILGHCVEHNVPEVVVTCHSDIVNKVAVDLDVLCEDTHITLCEADKLEETVLEKANV